MRGRINIAVIGCGYWGPNLVRNFLRVKRANVSCVCDLDKRRLRWIKNLYPYLEVTTDYKKILKDPRIEAIAIATPPSTHYILAKEAIDYGKHILVEKPFAENTRKADLLIKLASKNKRIIMVGYTYLFAPGIRKLKEIISKKKLGKILYINSIRVSLGLFQKDVNVVLDLGPHDVSIMTYLLNKTPLAVSATGSSHYYKGIEDVAFINLYYPEELIAHIHLSWIDPLKIRKITIVGEKEMVVYDDLNTEEPIKIFQRKVDKIPYYKDYGEFKMLYRFGDTISPKVELTEPLYLECEHFIDCIINGKIPLTSATTVLEVVKILKAVNNSLRNKGKMIKLK